LGFFCNFHQKFNDFLKHIGAFSKFEVVSMKIYALITFINVSMYQNSNIKMFLIKKILSNSFFASKIAIFVKNLG
jgi:hypothetical protein